MKGIRKQILWILFFSSIISSAGISVFFRLYPTPAKRLQVNATVTEISTFVWIFFTLLTLYLSGQTLFRKAVLPATEKEENARNILYSLITLVVFWLGTGFGSYIGETFQQHAWAILSAAAPAFFTEYYFVRKISVGKKLFYLSGTLGFLVAIHSIVLIAFVAAMSLDGFD